MFYGIYEPPLDPPEEVVVAHCDCCGDEIYEGEDVYEIDGDLIHEDCLWDYAKRRFADCKRQATREQVYA